ncbi:hypothetical protein [Actinophytocola sp.]|uniref:hypothetical protein n=1 Tax=Actinophytocola sp. TaxID=1872138 RepID=UPI002D7E695E|nr:hypothetical protein [Actinophytocola sp.]HET9144093.1 hypothetical protein [Actinophytocola sp.]
MSNAQTALAAPPAVTTAEKAAMLAGTVLVAVLLTLPVTRGIVVDSVVTTLHFVADVAASAAHAVGSVLGLA